MEKENKHFTGNSHQGGNNHFGMDSNESKLVCFRTSRNLQLIDPDEIICCILEGRNVKVFLISDESIDTVHNLKEVVEKLKHKTFIKCNSSCLVNLNKRLIFDSKNHVIELQNKQKNKVSKRQNTVIGKLLK
jgi:DNA-binding LytR/AlgR family response regulator